MKFSIQNFVAVCLLIQVSLVHSACNLTPKISFPDGKKENKRLDGLAVVNTTVETAKTCFGKCVEDCQCESINVCGNICQLNSGNEGDAALSDSSDCTYYELSWEQPASSERNNVCKQDEERSCCGTGNPCLNGGLCVEQCPTSSRKRYRCTCPQFVNGERCENVPKSCRSFYDNNPNVQSGVYTLFDDTGNTFPAFCDFTMFDGLVWTLVQSFSLGNRASFYRSPLFVDNPRNEANPSNWEDYRLPKEKFQSIQSNATHTRYTCNYDSQTIDDMKDYLRFKNEAVDLLTYDSSSSGSCIMVEKVDIRGSACSHCTISIIQTQTYNVYTCPTCSSNNGCDFHHPAGSANEENFGGYDFVNAEHRCSSSSTSTTNLWYGS